MPSTNLLLLPSDQAKAAPDLARICEDLEIEIVPTKVCPGDNQTCAGATLASILYERGAGHLIIVLRTIVESAGNQRALKAPIIWAISDLVRTQPGWADRGMEWVEAFDDIDLISLMKRAQANRQAVQLRHGICAMLFERLSVAFGRPAKVKVFAKKSALLGTAFTDQI